MRKRGSFGLSFGMIFSIIIIIAIIGVSFYVINNFLGLQKCAEQSLFYDEFQKQIDIAWNSEITERTYEAKLPGGIDRVCLGDASSGDFNPRYSEEYQKFNRYFRFDANLFLFPPEKACTPEYFKLKHVDLTLLQRFDCFEVDGKNVEFKIEKGSTDALVEIGRP